MGVRHQSGMPPPFDFEHAECPWAHWSVQRCLMGVCHRLADAPTVRLRTRKVSMSRVLCDKMKDLLPFIPHKRAIFLTQTVIGRWSPLSPKTCTQSDPLRLWQISAHNISTIRVAKKLSRIESLPRAFQQAVDEPHMLPPNPPVGGWKSELKNVAR